MYKEPCRYAENSLLDGCVCATCVHLCVCASVRVCMCFFTASSYSRIQRGEDHLDAFSVWVSFRKRAPQLVALLRKETCNLLHSMHPRHPVSMGWQRNVDSVNSQVFFCKMATATHCNTASTIRCQPRITALCVPSFCAVQHTATHYSTTLQHTATQLQHTTLTAFSSPLFRALALASM